LLCAISFNVFYDIVFFAISLKCIIWYCFCNNHKNVFYDMFFCNIIKCISLHVSNVLVIWISHEVSIKSFVINYSYHLWASRVTGGQTVRNTQFKSSFFNMKHSCKSSHETCHAINLLKAQYTGACLVALSYSSVQEYYKVIVSFTKLVTRLIIQHYISAFYIYTVKHKAFYLFT